MSAAASTATGEVTGRIIDAVTGQGISSAGVQVAGTTIGSISGVDGRFIVRGVPSGTVSLIVRRIGYGAKTITDVSVPEGGRIAQDISLSVAELQIASVTVTASAERGTAADALNVERTSTGIVSSVSAEQIARSPDGDAAQAIQRVSGVTMQDGRSAFVRGLGERYTITNVNGARMPSPEPEKRFVPLDIFPSSLLQSISTTKSFTPDLAGDFSGAAINIETREFPLRATYNYSITLGMNSAATGQTLPTAPTAGGEWMALGDRSRNVSSMLSSATAVGQLTTRSLMNQAVSSLRNAWTPTAERGLPNGSLSFSAGGQEPLGSARIGYIGSFTYSASQEARADDYQANLIQRDGHAEVIEYWKGEGSRRSVLWGGMLNASAILSPAHRVSLNNTYTRSADNDARDTEGPAQAFSGAAVRRMTLRYVERVIQASQLKGEHTLGTRQNVDWSVSLAGVRRREPDRSDLVYAQFAPDAPFSWSDGNPDVARRTYGDLRERNWQVAANYRRAFGESAGAASVKVGALYLQTTRDALNRQFSIVSSAIPVADRSRRAEELFDGRFSQDTASQFTIINVSGDGAYDAADRQAAAYAMAELPLGARTRATVGARFEHSDVEVNTALSNGGKFRAGFAGTDVLPALVLNTKVGDVSQVRFSASRTLARPEYREMAPIQYLEIIGGQITRGNADLQRTLIQNYDLKFEQFPNNGEVLSVGVFMKRFDRPIERIDIGSAGGAPSISFFNAAGAHNYGVELEVRKDLGRLSEALDPYSIFGNLTLMQSNITVGGDASANTNAQRAMVGQAPWVSNVGITWYSLSGRSSATLLYSAVGRRIHSAGTIPFPDVYEETRHMADASVRWEAHEGITLRIDGRNLLDAPYRLTQAGITREGYRAGRQFSMGLQWKR